MTDSDPTSTNGAGVNGVPNSLLLRCTRCGLVLNDPETGLLRSVQDEAHNGRCLFCFPLPTRENIAEMRRLQVEEYRLRLETTRGGHGSEAVVPPTADQASVANTCRDSTLVTDTIDAATDRNTTFNASVTQAIPVTPAAIGCQRNGGEHQVNPAALSVDSRAQGHSCSYGLRPGCQDEGQGQATAFRPRTLLNDDDVNAGQTDGHGADHTDTPPSTQENAETDEQMEEKDMAAEDAASGSPQDASTSHLQSTAPSPSLATVIATAAGATGGGGSVPDGSFFSIVAMFEAQEREDNGGSGDDGGIEEVVMAFDGDRTKDGEDEGRSDHKINNKRKDPPDKSDASTMESVNGSFSPSVTAPAVHQQNPPSESLSQVENESDSEGENSRKRIRSGSCSAFLNANDPLFKEIQTYITEGQAKDISVGQRDVYVEKLRVIIENEESTNTKKQHASTMISLEAPKMIVTAMQRIAASFVSLKMAKARNACARYMSECCHTLATLAYYGRAQSVVDVGAIPATISALEMNAKIRNPKLYLHGIEALQTLSVCATEEILENEGLAMISSIVVHLQTKIRSNSSRDTKHTLRMIMRLLDNMSSSSQLGTPDERDNEDAERARAIGQRGLLKPILEVIVNLPDDVELQLAVCSAIASLSASEDNCNVFVQLGGIRSFVFLSHRHRLSSDLQIAIADCFAWLVADQEEHSKQACKDGVVTTCVELLNDSNMSMSVIRSALRVLDIIGDGEEGVKHLLDAKAVSAVATLAEKAENNDDFRLLCQNFLDRLHGYSNVHSFVS